jgi:ABC-type dipeptide/oligopeptide/nickel transport system permease component
VLKFIFRRILWMVLVLFVVSLITFLLMHSVPGGPFTIQKRLPEATLKQLNAKYHLDAPLYIQYIDYIRDIVIPVITTGKQTSDLEHKYLVNLKLNIGDQATLRWMDFGPSFRNVNRTVSDIFRDNLPISMQLGAAGIFVTVVIGIPLGIISGLKRNTMIDYVAMALAVFGVSVPVIILAPVLQYLMGVQMGILPVSGWGTFKQIILPAFALGVADSALIARLTRASLLEVMGRDYIRTARAKGLNERMVVFKHALRNSLIPIVTVLGPIVAYVMTGTFVVETIFGIPGMGKFFVTSVSGRDYPVIMGTVLLLAMFLVMANTLVDIVYIWLDPRIRYE